MQYKKGFINVVAALIIGGLAVVAGAFIEKSFQKTEIQVPTTIVRNYNLPKSEPVVGAAPQFTSAAPTTLYGSGISSSDTSIKLNALTTPNGYPIATADVVGSASNVFYLTIEPASTRKETVSCTTILQNNDGTATVSGCTRGLLFTYPYTASTTLQKSHAGGSSVVLSNSPQLYSDIITYIQATSQAGVVNDASLIAKGIGEIATAAEAGSNAQVGTGNTSAYLLLTSSIASSSRVANIKTVVVASSTGYIDNSFISTSTGLMKNITFSGVTTLSTTTATSTMLGSFPAYWIGKNIKVFTSSGTFTVPSGINKIYVRMVGGGGGGGGGSGAHVVAGTGGGGGYGEGMLDITGTTSIAITIGAAGTGSGGSSTGGTGGTTFVSSFANCTGGTGGSGQSAVPATTAGAGGGTCTGTDISIQPNAMDTISASGSADIYARGSGYTPLLSYGQGGFGGLNGSGTNGGAGLVLITW